MIGKEEIFGLFTFHCFDEGFYDFPVYIVRNNNDQVYLVARVPCIHNVATLHIYRIEPSNQGYL